MDNQEINPYSLTKENYIDVSYNYYQNTYIVSNEEMIEDLDRISSIKRLIRNYIRRGSLNHKLLVIHVVILNNVFDTNYMVELLLYMMQEDQYKTVLKTVFLYLGYVKEDFRSDIAINNEVANLLRSI